MKFSVFQASHPGGRRINEDRVAHYYTQDAVLLLLADGLGGYAKGDEAARIALRAAAEAFDRLAEPAVPDPAEFLKMALKAGHQRILDYAASMRMPEAPLTTLVAALIQDQRLYWIHCGDSRLYVVRNGQALVRTRDHSWAEYNAQEHLVTGNLSLNLLYTSLGTPKPPMFDMGGPLTLQTGDKLLLCSDGLWNHLNDEEITAALSLAPVRQSATDLVQQACARGVEHCDNVSVVALDWGDADLQGVDVIDTVQMARHGRVTRPINDLPDTQGAALGAE